MLAYLTNNVCSLGGAKILQQILGREELAVQLSSFNSSIVFVGTCLPASFSVSKVKRGEYLNLVVLILSGNVLILTGSL